MSNKLRVLILYGGRSGEHEVSLRSACSVLKYLDRTRFEPLLVGIAMNGDWLLQGLDCADVSTDTLRIKLDAPKVALSGAQLVCLDNEMGGQRVAHHIDVVFPVMHGPLCEDGAMQGLLEVSELPYVGSGVLASAVSMDKDLTKRLAKAANLPILPYICIHKSDWEKNRGEQHLLALQLGLPVFVKPANMGSSVGVHKVKDPLTLNAAIDDAFQYDRKILVERGISAREIELAVLESPRAGESPKISEPGEIVPAHEFYSYEAKYLDPHGAKLMIPAPLDSFQISRAQELALAAFRALECEGLARVDLFIDRDTEELYFNEINTIPGFTSISMYPKMMMHSGVPYPELLSRLIDLAVLRGERTRSLRRNAF